MPALKNHRIMNLTSLETVLVVLLVMFAGTPASAQGVQRENPSGVTAMRYPDWSGQWERIGSLNWPPEGYEKADPAPLTPEYKAIYDKNQELRANGVLAGDPPATCLPP